MALNDLDVIVRVAGATLLLWAALANPEQKTAARPYFIGLAICVASFLAGNTPDPDLRLSGFAGRLAVVLAGYAAVLLWWWCLSVFDRAFRPRGLTLLVGLAWIAVATADRGLLGPALADRGLSWSLLALGGFMIGHLAWRLLSDRSGDLVDDRRGARVWVVALLAGQLLIDMAVDVFLGFAWRPQVFTIAQNAAFLVFTAWLIRLDFAAVHSSPARANERPARDPVEAIDPRLMRNLTRLLEIERIHLDPDLTFARFVAAMDAPERAVRRLINRQLGHDHFRSFLNLHRVAEAKRRLADPAHRHDKLIAIALDSGFASLLSFNRAFREIEGRSPSAVRTASTGF